MRIAVAAGIVAGAFTIGGVVPGVIRPTGSGPSVMTDMSAFGDQALSMCEADAEVSIGFYGHSPDAYTTPNDAAAAYEHDVRTAARSANRALLASAPPTLRGVAQEVVDLRRPLETFRTSQHRVSSNGEFNYFDIESPAGVVVARTVVGTNPAGHAVVASYSCDSAEVADPARYRSLMNELYPAELTPAVEPPEFVPESEPEPRADAGG